jgi:hypothetical protein
MEFLVSVPPLAWCVKATLLNIAHVATTVVGFPPIVCSPAWPLPILLAVVLLSLSFHCCRGCRGTGTLPRTSHRPPPSRPIIVHDWTPAQIPAEASTCTTPGPCVGCRLQGWPYRCPTTVPFERSPPYAFPQWFSFTFGVSGIRGGGVGLQLCVLML